jgi:lysophospholipase L1-like esterase
MNNNYINKLFSILGDSISTFEGVSEPKDAVYYDTSHKLTSGVTNINATWWGQVIESLEGELLVNNSFSGSTVCWHPLYEAQTYGCSDERTSSLGKNGKNHDGIMVYMGTNDWGCGTRILYNEKYDCVENNPGLFAAAYRIMLEKLRKNYPEAEIWCFTLSVTRWSKYDNFKFPYCYGGIHMSEYCNAIRESAEKFGCRVIDLYQCGKAYDTIDAFHPNADGMKTIAETVLNALNC